MATSFIYSLSACIYSEMDVLTYHDIMHIQNNTMYLLYHVLAFMHFLVGNHIWLSLKASVNCDIPSMKKKSKAT